MKDAKQNPPPQKRVYDAEIKRNINQKPPTPPPAPPPGQGQKK